MKKVLSILLSCMALCALTACVDFYPSDTPYGVWKCESQGFNFTLDIDPQVDILAEESGQGYSKLNLYPGEYMENGEPRAVYVSVFDPTNRLRLFYVNKDDAKEDKANKESATTYYTIDGVLDVYSEDEVVLLGSSYRVIDGRLRLQLSQKYKEKYGIDYLYLDLVKEYEVPDWSKYPPTE
jgi:hypothetical protein